MSKESKFINETLETAKELGVNCFIATDNKSGIINTENNIISSLYNLYHEIKDDRNNIKLNISINPNYRFIDLYNKLMFIMESMKYIDYFKRMEIPKLYKDSDRYSDCIELEFALPVPGSLYAVIKYNGVRLALLMFDFYSISINSRNADILRLKINSLLLNKYNNDRKNEIIFDTSEFISSEKFDMFLYSNFGEDNSNKLKYAFSYLLDIK